MEWLDKARRRSDSAKNKIAMVSAAAITLCIVGIWILVMRNAKTPDDVAAKSKSDDLKPLFMIFKNAKTGFQDVRANMKSQKAASSEATEGEANMIE